MSARVEARTALLAPRWRLVLIGFVVSLAVAAGIAELLQAGGDWNAGIPWERSLMLALPHQLPWALDLLFLTAPWLSSNTTVFPIITLLALWLWLARGRPDLALWLWVVDLGTFIFTPLLKIMYSRARPDLWPHRGQYAWASYPSGHAMIGVAVFTTVAVIAYRERRWRWPAWVLAALLCVSLWSRIYLGVHWPTDVVAGIVIGAVWTAFTLPAFARRPAPALDEAVTPA